MFILPDIDEHLTCVLSEVSLSPVPIRQAPGTALSSTPISIQDQRKVSHLLELSHPASESLELRHGQSDPPKSYNTSAVRTTVFVGYDDMLFPAHRCHLKRTATSALRLRLTGKPISRNAV